MEIKVIDTDNREHRTVQTYDALNRLRTVTRFAAGLPDNATRYVYDKIGNRTSVIDAESHETKYEFDYQRNITNVIDALQNETVFEYSGTGCTTCGGGVDKLTAVKDPNHVKKELSGTVYTYDNAGRLETEADPIGKKLRYTYYDNGLLKGKYDVTSGEPGTLLVTHLYSKRGQLTDKLYADNTSVHFSYTPNGWLETASTYTGTSLTFGYSYDYYDDGRLQSVTDSSGRQISYDAYDGLGRKKQVTVLKGSGADERVITYDYDDANRPWHITSSAGSFTYGYDEKGRRKTLTGAIDPEKSLVTVWNYDNLDRLTGVTHKTESGNIIAHFGYPQHDQVGNIKQVTGDRTASYGYDEIYRLLSVTSTPSETYTYDDAGNRTSGPGAKDTTYLANDGNQLVRGRTLEYGYDNFGNQTTRTVPGATDKTWALTCDYENRLKQVEKVKGGERKTVSFRYDPFGRRIGKVTERATYDPDTRQYVTKTESYAFLYDGEDIAVEFYTPPGGPEEKTWYTHGAGIDEHLAMERSGRFYYYHADGLGSIAVITDSGHAEVERYNYDAYGMVTPQEGFRNSFTYTGREWDPEIGLYYYRARYYDPMEGRFVSKDPIGFEGGINLYMYVQQNPVRYTDPTGLIVNVCKRDLNFPVIGESQRLDPRLHHAFISVNGEIFGLTTHKPSYNTRCGIEGPGAIDYNLGIDRAAEVEGFMNASCKKVSCKNEKKLLDNLRRARFSPPHYCLKPGSGNGINCQEWANNMIAKYCSCEGEK